MERTKFSIILGVLTISLALLSLSARADIINVPDDFETIQAGINAAEDGDTVLVAPGEYEENLEVETGGIIIASYFLIEEDPELIELTVINGGNRNNVIEISHTEDITLIMLGFTITGGNAQYGGGINCSFANVQLKNLIITDNEGSIFGGGIYFFSCNEVVIENSIIRNNSARFGAGITCHGSESINLINCQITGNNANDEGGGIEFSRANVLIFKTLIADNSAGIYGGGAIFAMNSDLILSHLTITGNEAPNSRAGIFLSPGSIEINNSIIWNHDGLEISAENGDSINVDYSDIEGGRGGMVCQSIEYGDNNIDEDPLFVDPDNGNFHLTADSPCIDAGDPESPPDPDSTRADMGAFFFHRRDICVVPDTLMFGEMAEAADTLNLVIRNLGHENLEIITHWFEPVNSPFYLISDEEDFFVIEPESDHVMSIAFVPPGQGDYRGVFNIISDDPDEETVTVMLIGSALSAEDPFILHPSAFILHEPFPNPFNSVTRIAYNLQQADYIELAVYDLTGRKVDVIEHDFKPGGCYTTSYDASHLPSGVYTLSLTTAERSSVRKMLLIK